jgi:hypothetical protein
MVFERTGEGTPRSGAVDTPWGAPGIQATAW